ncbi:MAG: HNH endonuclease, partial [Candidatus Binataceae bacterium]
MKQRVNRLHTCQMCGAVAGEPHPYDSSHKTRLHMGHVVDKSAGGADTASNLRAICSVCNEGASNLTLQRPDAFKLLVQVRRASGDDQCFKEPPTIVGAISFARPRHAA